MMSDSPTEPPPISSGFPTPPPPPPGLTAPPGYVPYGGAGTPGAYQPAQRVGGLAKGIVILLGISIPLSIISLLVTVSLTAKARDFLNGEVSASDFEDTYNSQIGVSLLPSALTIAIAVLTIIWMFRLARNLRVIGRQGATWSPGFAIGGWFLPPCAIYAIPWLMLKELWRGSDPHSPPGDPNWKNNPVSPLVTVWWVLFGLIPVLSLVASISSFSDISTDFDATDAAKQLDDQLVIAIIGGIANIAAAGVFLMIVRQLTANHRQLTRET